VILVPLVAKLWSYAKEWVSGTSSIGSPVPASPDGGVVIVVSGIPSIAVLYEERLIPLSALLGSNNKGNVSRVSSIGPPVSTSLDDRVVVCVSCIHSPILMVVAARESVKESCGGGGVSASSGVAGGAPTLKYCVSLGTK
jgi:hypothetical protein